MSTVLTLPDSYYHFLDKWEGGYVNDPLDMGGETNRGITLKTWQSLAPRLLKIEANSQTLKAMTEQQWRSIVNEFYKLSGGNLIRDRKVALHVLDSFWGGGVYQLRFVQGVLNLHYGERLILDGVVGPRTAEALNRHANSPELFPRLIEARRNAMRDIVRRTPSQNRFLQGWLNRINDFETQFKDLK